MTCRETSWGCHRGLAYYTVGQRKGLGITSREPLHVIQDGPDEERAICRVRPVPD